ncbi:MAG: AmmeMemoRadiSam system protein A [Candidatus Nealsonbacteria bacterium]|nr:AmmeMemoRadiSam system protein A [Candidatus Nealsonbacteria bacterium]
MHPLVLLAKSAIENYIENNKIISIPSDFPKEYLKRKAGVFVTIMKQKKLRGCIGTYLATKENIAEEVIENAITAATQDHRFGKIKKEELLLLSYVVYILGTPEIITDLKELNPKKYGIIIKNIPSLLSEKKDAIFDDWPRAKSGLLLPDLEGIDNSEEQIDIACQKAGIDPEREGITIYKFSAEKYGE